MQLAIAKTVLHNTKMHTNAFFPLSLMLTDFPKDLPLSSLIFLSFEPSHVAVYLQVYEHFKRYAYVDYKSGAGYR